MLKGNIREFEKVKFLRGKETKGPNNVRVGVKAVELEVLETAGNVDAVIFQVKLDDVFV